LLAWRRLSCLPLPGYGLLIAIPMLLWLLPLIWYVWRFPGDNPIWWVVGFSRPPTQPAAAFHGFLTYQLPLLLVGRFSFTTVLEYSILGISLIAVLYTIFSAICYRSVAAVLLLALVVSTIGLFVFSSFGYLFTEVRYVLPLMIALPLLMASAIAGLRRVRYGSICATIALLGILLANSITIYRKIPLDFTFPPRDEAILAASLQQHGIRFIHSSYWIAMPIIFESGGQMIASTLVGPNRTSYDRRNEQRVLAAQGDATAFVFKQGGSAQPLFDDYIDKHHIACDRFMVRHFVVYDRCTPFPDVFDVSKHLPELLDE
jgi:hypothetical protein